MSGEEARFVHEAFESNYIAPLGPQVDAFEKELAEHVGAKGALASSSGTAAMHLEIEFRDWGPSEIRPSTISRSYGVNFTPHLHAPVKQKRQV